MDLTKKLLSLLMMLVMTLGCMCVGASAASGADAGICDVEAVSGVTVTPKQADGTAATLNGGGVYVGAARMTITFSGATAGKYYLVMALDGEGYPTVDNLVYMDQATAPDGSVSFDVYPGALESGQTYYVYISSNDGVTGYEKVASFGYYMPYKLGDVNEDGRVESVDALRVLRAVVGQITLTSAQELAADVNRDARVESVDALRILRYVVGQITEF